MAPAATSPILTPQAYSKASWSSPSPPSKCVIKPQINTSVPLTLTPATGTTPSYGPSSATSPLTSISLQSSPDALQPRIPSSSLPPTPLHLPETAFTAPSPLTRSAMSEAMEASKGPGLIRRLSQGARNRLRRRPSSNHVSNRDRSSGPVMLRRRSDSKMGPENEDSLIDSSTDFDIEDVPEDLEEPSGLGLAIEGMKLDTSTTPLKPSRTEGGIGPIVPDRLKEGTKLQKITKKKRKDLTFRLDIDSAKVTWDRSDPSKQFYIDDIQQIRPQAEARNYREEYQVSADCEARWFTIIYADQERLKGRPMKTMHLIAQSQHDFELWTSTLDEVSRHRHELMAGLAGSWQDDRTLQGHWKREMARLYGDTPRTESEETLDFASVESLCRSLHIHCSKNVLRGQFDRADADHCGRLSFNEFKDFVRRLKHREDIRSIFKSLSPAEPSESIELDTFLEFLQITQRIPINTRRDHWVKVFARYARKSDSMQDGTDPSSMLMSFSAFSAFLSSPANNVLATKIPENHTFDRPLNEYFISSSHNTYLMGRQFGGSSSVEAYIRVLQRGCRCVEIDCWDGPDGRPIVLHGRTMTSSVSFSDCISVIAKYAFQSSPYPLIISLEVHCNPLQQQAMVDTMVKEFGDHLLKEPITSTTTNLPPPEELKHKILLKVKTVEEQPTMPPESAASKREQSSARRERSFSSPWSRPQLLDNSGIPYGPTLSSSASTSPPDHVIAWQTGLGSVTTTSTSSSSSEDSDSGRKETLRPVRGSIKTRKSKNIKSLSNLAIYTRGHKLSSFSSPESRTYNHVISLAERRFEALCKDPDTKAQLEKHNMRHLMRVYPSGYRIHSSNPDPLLFWRRGVQMVALNWQTHDLPMQLNEAMFAAGTDRLGYVLKPRELRESMSIQEEISEPSIHGLGKLQKKLIRFSVDMISAQQLPKPRGVLPDATIDPYIEIEMFSAEDKAKGLASGEGGHDASTRSGFSGIGFPHRRRTHVVQANGFNPIFDERFKLSLETKYPSLVFVRWTVWGSQDGQNYNNNPNSDPLATFTAKLSSLESGYRHIPLYDHNGEQFMFATLFCKIDKKDPVTVEREDPVPEKSGRFKQLHSSVFKRTTSVDKRSTRPTDRKTMSSDTVRTMDSIQGSNPPKLP